MSVSSIGGTYGLSGSGMDIDALVTKLMAGQQAKSDALLQKKTVAQWQKTAYNTVYDDISKFRETLFNYKLQGTLSPNKVSSSNTSVATVTANSEAADVNHSLVVAQLASGVNITSTASISAVQPPIYGTLATQLGMSNTGPIVINITNGTAASLPISIDPLTETINDVVSKINNAGVNVKASYDSTLDRFFLTTTNTGTSSEINFNGSDQNGLDFLGGVLNLSKGTTETPVGSGVYTSTPVNGLNAEFKLDGIPLSQASNTFTISGVTYSLTGESPNVGSGTIADKLAAGEATNVSVTNDVDKAVANVQSLVDSYNKILADLNGKVNETRYKDFLPLSDAQKSAMKESDITAWEAKAKSGLLHNDQTLSSLVNSMRSSFSNPVSGIAATYDPATGKNITYNSAASIGITTGNYSENGKLYLDTNKLKKALNASPDVLNQLFGASGEKSDGTTDISSQGIAGRLYDGIKNKMDQLLQTAGTTGTAQYDVNSSYAKKITAYNLQISNAADRFDKVQAAYYKQFNAMEVALQKLSSQSSWLSSVGSTS